MTDLLCSRKGNYVVWIITSATKYYFHDHLSVHLFSPDDTNMTGWIFLKRSEVGKCNLDPKFESDLNNCQETNI